MSGNLITFIIALILGLIAYWFGLRPEKLSFSNQRWLVIFIWLLSFFVLFNAFLAFVGWRSLHASVNTPPITNFLEWQRAGINEGIVLVGSVSEQNEILRQEDVVAYFECGESCYLFVNPPLLVSLSGVTVPIENRDFQEREWVYERGLNYSHYNLAKLDPVVVVGERVNDSIHAEIVYRGNYDDFIDRAQRRIPQAAVMIGLNSVIAASFIALGFGYWEEANK